MKFLQMEKMFIRLIYDGLRLGGRFNAAKPVLCVCADLFTIKLNWDTKQKNKKKKAMKNTEPKYEYHLYTWGGFYNEEYLKIHQKPRGDFWFDTTEERQQFIDELKAIEEKLNARHLAMTLSEGYCCRTNTVLHRVIEWKGERYYSKYDIGINYPFSAAKYHLEYKWTCGFNDYPLGEDFDYDENQPKVIQEWITGAEQEMEFER